MIIDTHCHMMTNEGFLAMHSVRSWAEMFAAQHTQVGKPTTQQYILDNYFAHWIDPDGDKIVALMDKAKIDKTFILGELTDFVKEDAPRLYKERNQTLGTIVKRHPDRLVFFGGVYPLMPNALQMAEECINKWGAKGVKLDPMGGSFSPDNPAIYPIYELLQARKLTLVVHCGPRPEDPQSKFGHPTAIAKVAADFPGLTIIAAHMGFAWWRDLIEVGKTRPNVMCDISANQLSAHVNFGRFCYMLRKVMDGFGSERMTFGTDGPWFDYFISRPDWVQLIKDLPVKSTEQKFTEKEVTNLLGENANRLLTKK